MSATSQFSSDVVLTNRTKSLQKTAAITVVGLIDYHKMIITTFRLSHSPEQPRSYNL